MAQNQEGKRPRCSETAHEKRLTARLRVMSRIDALERDEAYGVLEITFIRGRIAKLRTIRDEQLPPAE